MQHGAGDKMQATKNPQSLVLCGFHGLLGMLLDFLVVPGAGLEPARLAAGDFESPASTNFATRAEYVKP